MLLDGVRVVSLCHYLQGPAAAQYLADMGADVIKVEPVGGAYERHWSGARVFVGEVSGFYLCANRNKRSVSLNLKSEEGRAAFLRIVASADVVMENFRPGTLDRLGLGHDTLRSAKSDIIFASASGYGADGPYRDLPGQDLLIQARTGLVSATAGQQPDVLPAAAGCAVVDQHGAALFALGIVGALYKRLKTGAGTRVESSLFNAGIDLQQESITNYVNGRMTPAALRRDPHLATWFHEAPYGIYALADGRHLALSLNPLDVIDQALTEAGAPAPQIEGPCSSGDPIDAYRDRDRIASRIAARFREISLQKAEQALSAHGLWYAPVVNYSELLDDPQARHNGVFTTAAVKGETAFFISHPNRYDGQAPSLRHLSAAPGQDTGDILAEVGFTADEVAYLVACGAAA
jgi:crotonobetainyl-CoA:carnitine CoA-transferase CaiB-like acyl-CoA transferase